jgi:hypothetical protein
VVASICDLCRIETDLYKRIKSYHRIIRTLAILVPFLWLGLSMTLTLSSQAFKDSELCRDSTFKDWYIEFLSFVRESITFPGEIPLNIFLPIFGSPFALCLFRRRSQVMADVRAYWKGGSKPWERTRIPWTFVKCAWCVAVVVGP